MSWRNQFEYLTENPKTWLVTGVAGFIGSNLLEHLLKLNQRVVGLDNFELGFRHNLDSVRAVVGPEIYESQFTFYEGDIRSLDDCTKACEGVDYVLHQAAVGSVPKSLEDPIRTHENNVDGFVNMLLASKDAGVQTFVFASSSSVYGDTKMLPQEEQSLGALLSPYAASKRTGEVYAQAFSRSYGMKCTGLRYFNVFGPRQSPEGAYAAVIPKWIASLIKGQPCTINGDGSIYRDFTYVENVVVANLLAALKSPLDFAVYNAALGGKITLSDLQTSLANQVEKNTGRPSPAPIHGPSRKGDILTSTADITKIKAELGFEPVVSFEDGIEKTVSWFCQNPSE